MSVASLRCRPGAGRGGLLQVSVLWLAALTLSDCAPDDAERPHGIHGSGGVLSTKGPTHRTGGEARSVTGGLSGLGTGGIAQREPFHVELAATGTETRCGACFILRAEVSGGAQPYRYQWSDDSLVGPGPHTVCPERSTDYWVTVTDTPVDMPEFEAEGGA